MVTPVFVGVFILAFLLWQKYAFFRTDWYSRFSRDQLDVTLKAQTLRIFERNREDFVDIYIDIDIDIDKVEEFRIIIAKLFQPTSVPWALFDLVSRRGRMGAFEPYLEPWAYLEPVGEENRRFFHPTRPKGSIKNVFESARSLSNQTRIPLKFRDLNWRTTEVDPNQGWFLSIDQSQPATSPPATGSLRGCLGPEGILVEGSPPRVVPYDSIQLIWMDHGGGDIAFLAAGEFLQLRRSVLRSLIGSDLRDLFDLERALARLFGWWPRGDLGKRFNNEFLQKNEFLQTGDPASKVEPWSGRAFGLPLQVTSYHFGGYPKAESLFHSFLLEIQSLEERANDYCMWNARVQVGEIDDQEGHVFGISSRPLPADSEWVSSGIDCLYFLDADITATSTVPFPSFVRDTSTDDIVAWSDAVTKKKESIVAWQKQTADPTIERKLRLIYHEVEPAMILAGPNGARLFLNRSITGETLSRVVPFLVGLSRSYRRETTEYQAPPPPRVEVGEYIDAGRCEICGDDLKGSRCMRCPECCTPHHIECWSYLGKCSTYACTGRPDERLTRMSREELTQDLLKG